MNCVTIESPGILWLGTNTHGVVRFNETLWTSSRELNSPNEINVFPIPCSSNLTIESREFFIEISVFDLAGEIPYQQIANCLHLITLASTVDFDSIVAQCIPVFQVHETQARRAFEERVRLVEEAGDEDAFGHSFTCSLVAADVRRL